MYRFFILACAIGCMLTAQARDRQNFDNGWRFVLADSAQMSKTDYHDTHWRALNLPHDWAVEGDFLCSNPSGAGGGALPGGIGWYRKTFNLQKKQGERYFIEFDGVYMNARVYINGKEVGYRPYGYSSFEYDITPYLIAGRNVVAVRVDNSDQPNSRWYSGCGIYRHVWFTKTADVHVKHWGVHVVANPDGRISVTADVESQGKAYKVRNQVFDALPFMPVVSQGEAACPAQLDVPTDGILINNSDSSLCLASHVREVMHYLWADRADDMEYELCQLIGCKSLQAYLASPTGFFDYHFKRYTKSRRKAPIYWLLASEDGTVDYWVYYPKLSKNTLPQLIIRLREQQEQLRTRLNAALAAHDKTQESQIRAEQEQVEGMMDELNRILAAGYVPNHDDGVPVTAAPLLHLAASRPWRVECEKNMELLEKGDYDWSHLAMSMYPARVTQKAKKDWCMALTHGLEHICENKPKEKKARKKKGDNINPQLSLSF